MAYCTECGTELLENGTCPKCIKTKFEASKETKLDNDDNAVEKAVEKFTNTADSTDDFAKKDITANTTFAVLAYFGVLIIIPLACSPDSKFARFHANQSLSLMIFSFIYAVIASVVIALCSASSTALCIFLSGIFALIGIIPFIMWIQGIANAASGKAKELPFIGKISILK